MAEPSSGGGSQGPSTDRHNDPVIDPTANVRDLVDAAVLRLDDLRLLSEAYIKEMAALRAAHDKEMREKEAQRIDAIRAVDVAASQQGAKDAEARATALAAQVAASAEAMRNQVAATAAAAATSLAAALAPIQQSIAELTQRMYEAQGQKQQSVETREVGADSRQQNQYVIYIVLGFVSLIMAVVTIYALATRSTTKSGTSVGSSALLAHPVALTNPALLGRSSDRPLAVLVPRHATI